MTASKRRAATLAVSLVVSVVAPAWLLIAATVNRSLNGRPVSAPAVAVAAVALAVFPVVLVVQRRTPVAYLVAGWFLLSGLAIGAAVIAA